MRKSLHRREDHLYPRGQQSIISRLLPVDSFTNDEELPTSISKPHHLTRHFLCACATYLLGDSAPSNI